jgi:hypothetical protein
MLLERRREEKGQLLEIQDRRGTLCSRKDWPSTDTVISPATSENKLIFFIRSHHLLDDKSFIGQV